MNVTVEINLNGRIYPVACTQDEAPRLRELGRQLQERMAKLQGQFGDVSVTDAHLLVLINLMALDELSDAQKSAKPAPVAQPPVQAAAPQNDNEQAIMVKAVEHLTQRVISIADRLKAA